MYIRLIKPKRSTVQQIAFTPTEGKYLRPKEVCRDNKTTPSIEFKP